MPKIIYPLDILQVFRYQVQQVTDRYPGIEVNTEYFDYFNAMCPRCKKKLKVFNKSVQGIGSVSVYVIEEKNLAVVYACCVKCCREIAKSSLYGTKHSEKAYQTEKFINSVIDI